MTLLTLALRRSTLSRMGESVAVKITAIVAATVVALAVIALLWEAISHGYGTETLVAGVGGVVLTYMNSINTKVARVDQAVAANPPALPAPQAPPPDAGA